LKSVVYNYVKTILYDGVFCFLSSARNCVKNAPPSVSHNFIMHAPIFVKKIFG